MAEPSSSGSIGLIALGKLVGFGVLGALLMAAVFPPTTRREFVMRVFVALVSSFMFVGVSIDWLHSMSMFSWIDPGKAEHVSAVAGLVGAAAWFVFGGLGVLLNRFRNNPPDIKP